MFNIQNGICRDGKEGIAATRILEDKGLHPSWREMREKEELKGKESEPSSYFVSLAS